MISFGPGQPTGGTFTISLDWDGGGPLPAYTTAPINWSSTASTLQGSVRSALENLGAIGTGNVTVGGPTTTSGELVITFQNALANMNIPTLAVNSSLTGLGSVNKAGVSTSTPGGFSNSTALYNEVQAFCWSAAPTMGSYTLTFNGQTTLPLNWDATADQVAAELNALSSIGTDGVTVTGNLNTGFIISFVNQNAGINIPNAGTAPGLVVAGPTGRVPAAGMIRDGGASMGGTYSINFRGQVTGSIPWNASAQQVQNALETLSTIGSPCERGPAVPLHLDLAHLGQLHFELRPRRPGRRAGAPDHGAAALQRHGGHDPERPWRPCRRCGPTPTWGRASP